MGVCVLGSINLDNVCRVARLPAPGETVMAKSFARFAGGKGANQAVAAAAWGVPTALIGAVGRDEAGEQLIAHLQGRGVDVSAIARLADIPSGQAQISVSHDGENMIVVVGGANQEVSATQVVATDTARHEVFLAQLETPPAAIEALFTGPAARQGVTILNAAPAAGGASALFPLCDLVVVNRGELAVFAGAAKTAGPRDAVALARELISRPGQTIIVTLGGDGVLAVTDDNAIEVPGHPARVVDSTGAGDCFCGVLAAALAEGCSLAGALALANQAAALSTESAGAAVPPNLRANTEARLAPPAGPGC